MRRFIAWLASVLLGTAAQIIMFIVAYRHLVFPFLSEEQRMDNAPTITFIVFPVILVITFLTVGVFFLLTKKN